MTFQELCNAVMLKATGKATILSPDNAKWKKILGIANLYQNAWLNEPGQKWNSRYDRAYEVGSISDEDAYELDETIEEISTARGDQIYIETEDGNRIKYDLVDYDDLQNYPAGKYCAVVGNNLVFNHTFDEESPEYGGTIFAPVYLGIEELTGKDDDIVVDNPYWLETICAAEYIRNDIVKQNQYGNLMAEANNLMTSMIRHNRGGQVRKIRGSWRNPGGLN